MHRDKTVARIVLVLSIVHSALAAPLVVRQRYLDLAESLTAASEKRSLDDESPHPGPVVSMPASDLKVAPDELGDSYFTARSSPSGSNRYLMTPILGARQLHGDPPPASGTLQMRNDLPGTSGTLPSQDHRLPASGDPQLNNDPQAGLGTPQVHNDPPPTSGAPSSQDDSSLESGDPQLHTDPTTSTSETPQMDEGLSSSSDELNWWANDLHGTSSESWDSEALWEWYSALGVEPGGSQFTQQETNSEADRFFDDARKRKLILGGIVAALAAPWGASYGMHKLFGSPGHKRASRDLASSDVVGRGASMHPQSSVSRALALANLRTRNEDLQLPSVLTSWALERLD